MSLKFMINSLIVVTGMFLSPTIGSAMPLNLSSFVGTYELIETKRGVCPTNLRVVQIDFQNQLAEHSLTLSGINNEGAPIMLYDLIALNAGPIIKRIPNPMFGGYLGTEYRKEDLRSGRIVATKRTRNMMGIINHEQNLDATFQEDSLLYRYSTYNSLVYPIVVKTDICQFQKISGAN